MRNVSHTTEKTHIRNTPVRSGEAGFLLIEMIVSVSIFSIVMVIVYGALLVLVAINSNVQALQSSSANVSFALDAMTRNIRTGSDYFCNLATNYSDAAPLPTGTRDCPGNWDTLFAFNDGQTGDRVGFRYVDTGSGGVIQRRIDYSAGGTTGWLDITSTKIDITRLEFVVVGSDNSPGSWDQPTVRISVEGKSKEQTKLPSDFHMQMFVTQRLLDVPSFIP